METNAIQEKPDYQNFWLKYGVRWKWWAVALNLCGSVLILNEIRRTDPNDSFAFFSSFMKVMFLFPLSILVVICIGMYIRFEVTKNNFKQKYLYFVLAVFSVLLPFLLILNARLIMENIAF